MSWLWKVEEREGGGELELVRDAKGRSWVG